MRAEQKIVHDFISARQTMLENNRSPSRMWELLTQEVDELGVELVSGNVEKIAQELPDVLWFCLTIAEIYGVDLEDAFWSKAIRNDHKYPEELFNNGMTYEEAATLCRATWNRDNDVNYTPDKI